MNTKIGLDAPEYVRPALTPKRPLRILIPGSWSTSGKSTIAATLLHPRIPGSTICSIASETLDASMHGVSVKRFCAGDLKAFHLELLQTLNHAIVDVSTSSAERVLTYLVGTNLIAKFDYFVIVVDPSVKAQVEALSTFLTLIHHGCDPVRIRFVLNRVGPDKLVELQFSHLFAYAQVNPQLALNPHCRIPVLAAFDECMINRLGWQAAISDETDYDAVAREHRANGDDHQAFTAAANAIAVGMAKQAASLLDKIFEGLDLETGTVLSNR